MLHHVKQTKLMSDMLEHCPNVAKQLHRFGEVFTQMVHAERFDVRTISMVGLVPRGEPDKLILMLESAQYTSAPVKRLREDRRSVSYQLVRRLQSLYSAFLGKNPRMYSMVETCPAFTDVLVLQAMYLLDRTVGGREDIVGGPVFAADNAANDLCIYSYLR